MNMVHKLFVTKATSVDEQNKTIRFKISDNQPDRMGEVVDQKSWSFSNFLNNPILLWLHRGSDAEPEDVLGNVVSLDVEEDGTYATARLDEDINPKAGLVWKQLMRGTLRTVSVGFIPHTTEYQDDVPVLKDNELLELSIVPIPANPRAIALDFKGGAISEKDAKWLLDSMKKEADLLERQLATNKEEKSMTDEQATAMIDTVSKLVETVTTLNEKVDAQAQIIESIQAEVTAEEVGDDPAPDPAPDPEPKPDPAKGGEDDQPGAGEDEFDENAELTPEQEAELEASFEEATADLETAA